MYVFVANFLSFLDLDQLCPFSFATDVDMGQLKIRTGSIYGQYRSECSQCERAFIWFSSMGQTSEFSFLSNQIEINVAMNSTRKSKATQLKVDNNSDRQFHVDTITIILCNLGAITTNSSFPQLNGNGLLFCNWSPPQ